MESAAKLYSLAAKNIYNWVEKDHKLSRSNTNNFDHRSLTINDQEFEWAKKYSSPIEFLRPIIDKRLNASGYYIPCYVKPCPTSDVLNRQFQDTIDNINNCRIARNALVKRKHRNINSDTVLISDQYGTAPTVNERVGQGKY
jgi:hypothetical protein